MSVPSPWGDGSLGRSGTSGWPGYRSPAPHDRRRSSRIPTSPLRALYGVPARTQGTFVPSQRRASVWRRPWVRSRPWAPGAPAPARAYRISGRRAHHTAGGTGAPDGVTPAMPCRARAGRGTVRPAQCRRRAMQARRNCGRPACAARLPLGWASTPLESDPPRPWKRRSPRTGRFGGSGHNRLGTGLRARAAGGRGYASGLSSPAAGSSSTTSSPLISV
jgi:hypothetical protein